MAYRRILLKISGEALAGGHGTGFDGKTLHDICAAVHRLLQVGVQVGIVVGGGNFWRGRAGGEMDRTVADRIGMLATVMNALALADELQRQGAPACVMTAQEMPQVAEPFRRDVALRHLEAGEAVIFGGGTGHPFFSTDTGMVLRAAEIDADIAFKLTMTDGVYDKDPNRYPDAVRYDTLTFSRVLAENLGVMDATAAALCRERHLPLLVFNVNDPENMVRAARGEPVGTLVTE